jgi:hypothetical protein
MDDYLSLGRQEEEEDVALSTHSLMPQKNSSLCCLSIETFTILSASSSEDGQL